MYIDLFKTFSNLFTFYLINSMIFNAKFYVYNVPGKAKLDQTFENWAL